MCFYMNSPQPRTFQRDKGGLSNQVFRSSATACRSLRAGCIIHLKHLRKSPGSGAKQSTLALAATALTLPPPRLFLRKKTLCHNRRSKFLGNHDHLIAAKPRRLQILLHLHPRPLPATVHTKRANHLCHDGIFYIFAHKMLRVFPFLVLQNICFKNKTITVSLHASMFKAHYTARKLSNCILFSARPAATIQYLTIQ